MQKILIPAILAVLMLSCHTNAQNDERTASRHPEFDDYWYAGVAELSSYALTQARYGEYREGTTVMVFVTEPFSRAQQVKLDNPANAGNDEVTVMKLNMTRKFLTGVYPYSMMTSSFVPVSASEYSNAIKVTTTSQEWCGHTFTQLNHQNNQKYKLRQFSYFQSEGDLEKRIEAPWLEDELWQRIRLAPESLPTGKISIFPSTMYLRLSHQPLEAQQATASIQESINGEYAEKAYSMYRLQYADRDMKIYFESAFPYMILGWEETYSAGFGGEGKMTTRARKIKTIKSPYWQKNAVADTVLRQKLGL